MMFLPANTLVAQLVLVTGYAALKPMSLTHQKIEGLFFLNQSYWILATNNPDTYSGLN
jgi:hypothetical protein